MYDDELNEGPVPEQTPEPEDSPSPTEDGSEAYGDYVSRAIDNVAKVHGDGDPTPAEAEAPEQEAPAPAGAEALPADGAADGATDEAVAAPEEDDAANADASQKESSPEPEASPEPGAPAAQETAPDQEATEAGGSLVHVGTPLSQSGALVAARGARQTLMDGFKAFKVVREASQRHLEAQDAMRAMKDQLDEHTEQLRYRIDIEQRYPQIISQQTAELEEATTLSREMTERAEGLDREKVNLEGQLSAMRTRHETQLRPYRSMAESTEGRALDNESMLNEIRYALANAETTLAGAIKTRDQRLAMANRTVDNAQERLRKLQSALSEMQGTEDALPESLESLKDAIAQEEAYLEAARANVASITEASRKDVEAAQSRVLALKQEQSKAELATENSSKEAYDRNSELSNLSEKAQAEEDVLDIRIEECANGADRARDEHAAAQERMSAAQAQLDEAEGIHSTPQLTIDLRNQVSREQADLDMQQDRVSTLASAEKELRRSTFKQRVLLVVAMVATVLLVIGIIVAIVRINRGRQQSVQPTSQTQVETTTTSDKEKEKETTTSSSSTSGKETGTSSSSTSGDSSSSNSSSGSNSSSSSNSSSGSSSSKTENGTSASSSSSKKGVAIRAKLIV